MRIKIYYSSILKKSIYKSLFLQKKNYSCYMGRCLVAVDCIEHLGDSSQRAPLDYASIAAAKKFEPQVEIIKIKIKNPF